MSNFDPSNIEFLDVRTVHFAAESPIMGDRYLLPDSFPRYEYQIGYVLEANKDEWIVRILLEIRIKGILKGTNSKKKLGRITTESYFFLKDFENWVDPTKDREDETVTINELMTSILLGLAFSTTRGILIARANDTIMEDIVLPVIAPQKLKQYNALPTQ